MYYNINMHPSSTLVYLRKVKQIPCKRIAEFNFKLLQNLLITGYILSKWNKNISPVCVFCNEIDTPEHQLFICNRVEGIWKDIGSALKMKLSYKHIILGLDQENVHFVNSARNTIISIVAYAIYCTWVKCEDSKQSYRFIKLKQSIKNYLNNYKCLFQACKIKLPWFYCFNLYCKNIVSMW